MAIDQLVVLQAWRMALTLLLKRCNGLVRFTEKELADYHNNDEVLAFKAVEGENAIDFFIIPTKDAIEQGIIDPSSGGYMPELGDNGHSN
jgi:hypothetical protein